MESKVMPRERGERRGLSDIRTAVATRLASRLPRKGENVLRLYLLAKEKERIEKQLACMGRTQDRLGERLQEVAEAMAQGLKGLKVEAGLESGLGQDGGREVDSPPAPPDPRWPAVPLEY